MKSCVKVCVWPGGHEDPSHPIVLDDPAHGRDPLPLPGVVGVVVLGQLLDLAAQAGHRPAVPQVGHQQLTVLYQRARGCNKKRESLP